MSERPQSDEDQHRNPGRRVRVDPCPGTAGAAARRRGPRHPLAGGPDHRGRRRVPRRRARGPGTAEPSKQGQSRILRGEGRRTGPSPPDRRGAILLAKRTRGKETGVPGSPHRAHSEPRPRATPLPNGPSRATTTPLEPPTARVPGRVWTVRLTGHSDRTASVTCTSPCRMPARSRDLTALRAFAARHAAAHAKAAAVRPDAACHCRAERCEAHSREKTPCAGERLLILRHDPVARAAGGRTGTRLVGRRPRLPADPPPATRTGEAPAAVVPGNPGHLVRPPAVSGGFPGGGRARIATDSDRRGLQPQEPVGTPTTWIGRPRSTGRQASGRTRTAPAAVPPP